MILRQYAPNVYSADFNLPEGTVRVEAEAFAGTGMASVLLPRSVVGIEAGAFRSCANLRTVIILGENTQIAPGAFEGCESLQIIAPADSPAQRFAQENGFDYIELN